MATRYASMPGSLRLDRRDFVRTCTAVASGVVLAGPLFGAETAAPPETNIAGFTKVPRGPHAIPGPFPGRVVRVTDPRVLAGDKVDGKVVAEMFERGVRTLTGDSMRAAFRRFFSRDDVVGIKVNPVGAPLINTRPELVDAVIRWLVDNKLPKGNIVIWDRFEGMLAESGYTTARFPGVRVEGLQMMDEQGGAFRDADGNHKSAGNFDREAFYLARGVEGKGVRGYKDDEFYPNQHVFAGEHSYFGTLLTRRLTKIVNLAAFKNTGHGISMATKNVGYAAVCNTGRLHGPLGFKVCTEVLAAPPVRDKLVLNVTDALRAQYDGGPDKNEQFVVPHHTLYFATDPFALDAACQREITAMRTAHGIAPSDHPRYTEYLTYAETLGLGVVDPARLRVVQVGG